MTDGHVGASFSEVLHTNKGSVFICVRLCVSVNLADEARMRLQPRMRERLVVLGQCCLFTLVFMGHPEEAGAAGEAGAGG